MENEKNGEMLETCCVFVHGIIFGGWFSLKRETSICHLKIPWFPVSQFPYSAWLASCWRSNGMPRLKLAEILLELVIILGDRFRRAVIHTYLCAYMQGEWTYECITCSHFWGEPKTLIRVLSLEF